MPEGQGASGRAARLLAALLLAAMLLALPHVLSFSQQELLVFLVINVLVVVSYRLLTLTGEWSLAHVVLMGAGGYASALYSKSFGVPVPISILCGAGTAGFIAYLLSFPLFRMTGFYFLIGSFAAGEVMRLIWKRFSDPFGGATGIKRIPSLPEVDLGIATFDPYSPVHYYYLMLAVAAFSILILYLVERSRIGLTFHAIHWQDKLAESVGVDTFRYRMLAFVVASFFAGLAGALYAHYVGTVNPNRFGVDEMVYVLIWAIVGGTATFYGPIVGVAALTILNEVVLRALGIDQMRPMLYGALLIASILFLPNGLESLVPKIKDWIARRKAKRSVAEQAAD